MNKKFYLNTGVQHTAAAKAFIARTSGLNAAHTNAYYALIDGLVIDGAWSLWDAFYVYATADAATAALSLVSATYNHTVNGSPTFTADSGYVGGASAWLDTNFNPTTASSPNFTQNNASAFLWTLTSFGSGTSYGGAWGEVTLTATAQNSIFPHFSDNNMYCDLNEHNTFALASTPAAHLFGASRSGSSAKLYWQGTTSSSFSSASLAPNNSKFMFLSDMAASARRPFTTNLAFGCFGSAPSVAQQTALYNRVHTYMQTIAGAP